MKIPQQVKIGAMTYDIQTSDRAIFNDSAVELYGLINHNTQVIRISGDARFSEQTQALTFWHEVVHGLTHERGIDWGDRDEEFTEELAKALHAFCVDNGLDFA